jgi:hypothetical protein
MCMLVIFLLTSSSVSVVNPKMTASSSSGQLASQQTSRHAHLFNSFRADMHFISTSKLRQGRWPLQTVGKNRRQVCLPNNPIPHCLRTTPRLRRENMVDLHGSLQRLYHRSEWHPFFRCRVITLLQMGVCL